MPLPNIKDISNFDKAIKSRKSFLSYLFLCILCAAPTIIIGVINNQKINKSILIQQDLVQKVEVKLNLNSNDGIISQENTVSQGLIEGDFDEIASTSFNIADWHTEGYKQENNILCSKDKKNKYWSIWSKLSKPLSGHEFKVRFLLKNFNKEHETLTIGMGKFEPSYAPEYVFQLNIFENDYRSIRIYGSDTSKPTGQQRLSSEPDINKEIVATINTKALSNNSDKLLVDLILEYYRIEDGKKEELKLDNPFEVNTRHINIDDGIVAQIGIGISQDGCFEIISIQ